MASHRPAVNAKLVLQADDVNVADVEEVRSAQIRRQILLLNLEVNYIRVLVATLDVIHRHCETLALGIAALDAEFNIEINRFQRYQSGGSGRRVDFEYYAGGQRFFPKWYER